MNEIRLREPTYVDDPEINDYLNGLGRRLGTALVTVIAQVDRVDEGHGFAKLENRVDMYSKMLAFFNRHIGDKR